MNKKLLVLVFIKQKDKSNTLSKLKDILNISSDTVFTYQNLDDEDQAILSFYVTPIQDERINLRKYFTNATIVHKKKQTFYTINALNMLIEKDFDLDQGNIDYKNCKIEWSRYQNHIILSSRGKLNLIPIKRVF